MQTYKCYIVFNASYTYCDEPLRNDYLMLYDGLKDEISICPSCERKIKSPQHCGDDMLLSFK